MQLSLGQGETHQAREERAICFGDKARRNRLDSIQKTSLPRNIPLDLFFFHVRLFRSKAAPRETMAPVCQEASGSRRPFVKGITSPAPSCPIRQRILKFRRISVARGITTVFFAPYPPPSTLSRHSFDSLPLLRLSSGPARNKRIRIRNRTLGLSWLFPTSVPLYMRAFQPAVEYERQLLLNGTQRYNGVGFSTTVSITRFIRLSRARVNRLIAWALFFLGYFACWWIASVNGRKDFSYEHVHTIHGDFIRQTGGRIGILFRIYRTENLTPVKYMSCTIILINFSFRFPLYLHNNVVRISDRVFIQLYVYNDFGLMKFNGNLMSWHYIFV